MIQKERIKVLNKHDNITRPEYVLYWMQASQRIPYNHALAYAMDEANRLNLPLTVCFGITNDFPEANLRHYKFMLEGLLELDDELKKMGINFLVSVSNPPELAVRLSKKAALLVCDVGYTKIQVQWRKLAAKKAHCPVIQVESDVIVPVEEASQKEEYSAATIRPKIKSAMTKYLTGLKQRRMNVRQKMHHSLNIEKILSGLKIDRTVRPSMFYKGGTSQALKKLKEFKTKKLAKYEELKNDPSLNYMSELSPYIHFGQISTLQIAMELKDLPQKDKESFLEELIIRRELAINFAHYNSEYDNYRCLPDWAKKTLNEHKKDKREYNYSLQKLEEARTHDPYWNAAQDEMVLTGKMHGYMRMYWGKKILEWSKTPEQAYRTALYLNNKYELDGRDPNGFAGIAWCFGKHDRPWTKREVFGTVRYMNDKGLERKFDIKKYVKKIDTCKSTTNL